eukprot:12427160-Karenia_brevis.AAC.1
MTTWRRLFTKHQQRFHPGTEDPGVLEAVHDFPEDWLIDVQADPDWRKQLPEPGAGMPMRPGYPVPEEIFERPPEDDPE